MTRKTKYKSVGVSDETYQMIIEIAKKEKTQHFSATCHDCRARI